MNTNGERLRAAAARLMAALLVFVMCLLGLRFVTRQVLVKRMGMDNALTRLILTGAEELGDMARVSVDWEALYPFAQGEGQQRQAGALEKARDKLLNAWDLLKTTAELYTGEYFPLRYRLAERMNAYQKLLGWEINPVNGYNNVITLPDGYLTACVPKRDIAPHAAAIDGLRQKAESSGAQFLYVQIPGKVLKTDAGIDGVLDFSNANADALLAALGEKGVTALDLREKAAEQGKARGDMFFRTDHHWTGETGLWAAGQLLEAMNERYAWGGDTGLADPARYRMDVHPGIMLGSQGKKVTLSRTAPEDITLIYPGFPTDLRLVIPSRGMDVSGDFGVLYDLSQLEGRDAYRRTPYAAFFYGENALASIANSALPEGKRLLVISESNDNCMTPFLALSAGHTDAIDLRQFTGSLEAYLDSHPYDLVVLAYAAQSIGEVETRTHTNLFDFR